MRNFIVVLLVLLTTGIVFPALNTAANSQTIEVDEQQVIYPLPFPGILADHPLYGLKQLRDKILIFSTRDNTKKAQLYLHLSDKHIAIALQLATKGKEHLAIKELHRAEDFSLKVPPLLHEAAEQGASPSADLITSLYQSNAKHREIITEVMKTTTQANVEEFNTILKKNEQVRKNIEGI